MHIDIYLQESIVSYSNGRLVIMSIVQAIVTTALLLACLEVALRTRKPPLFLSCPAINSRRCSSEAFQQGKCHEQVAS